MQLADGVSFSAHQESIEYLEQRHFKVIPRLISNSTSQIVDYVMAINENRIGGRPVKKAGKFFPYRLPDACPVCGAPAVKDTDGAFLRCTGAECPAQLSRNISHFVSRDAMDIEGFGSAIVESLIEKDLIHSPADIYYLTLDQMRSLWQKGDTAAQKLLGAIDKSKQQDLSRLIFALGIRQVGAKAGKVLTSTFCTLDSLMNADLEILTQVPDVGQVTAQNIVDWFAQPQS